MEKILGAKVTDEEMALAEERASDKLAYIIRIEGDLDGERRKPWYLARLIAEAVYQSRLSAETLNNLTGNKKDCAALTQQTQSV